MNKHFNKIIVAGFSLLAFACDKDELTGDSMLTPTSPTVSIMVEDSEVAFTEKDSTFTYTIELSEPQITDVAVTVKQIAGDATLGSDFTIGSSQVIIPANSTSATASVSVAADAIPEGTETFTIQIGDDATGNAEITPATIHFSIANVTEGDLHLHTAWDVDFTDATGTPLAATDVADMILYITDENGTIVETVDGAAFEDYVLPADAPDGEYGVSMGIYGVVDPGDLGTVPPLTITLSYQQAGVTEETTLLFPAAFSPFICPTNIYELATITKVGESYTVTPTGVQQEDPAVAYAGEYSANEPGYGDYAVTFTAGEGCNTITNDNFWDAGMVVDYVLNFADNTVTIPDQIMPYPPSPTIIMGVRGSGTFDPETMEMVVDYQVYDPPSGGLYDNNTHTFTRM